MCVNLGASKPNLHDPPARAYAPSPPTYSLPSLSLISRLEKREREGRETVGERGDIRGRVASLGEGGGGRGVYSGQALPHPKLALTLFTF